MPSTVSLMRRSSITPRTLLYSRISTRSTRSHLNQTTTMKFASAITLAAALVQATPTSPNPSGKSVLATFDDDGLKDGLPGVSAPNPVGNYKGLTWGALNVVQPSILDIPGLELNALVPQSRKNFAGHGLLNGLMNGGISITAQAVKSFDLISLYFGCQTTTRQTTVGVPIGCTVSVSGYRKGQDAVVETIIQEFNPTNPVSSKMQKATFDSAFAGLDRVDVAVLGVTADAEVLAAVFIDDVQLTTYEK